MVGQTVDSDNNNNKKELAEWFILLSRIEYKFFYVDNRHWQQQHFKWNAHARKSSVQFHI